MDRVNNSTAQVDKFGPGKNGHTNGNPGIPTPATIVDDVEMDAFQEEIVRTIEGAGIVPDSGNLGQLLLAINQLVQNSAVALEGYQSGAEMAYNTATTLDLTAGKVRDVTDSETISVTAITKTVNSAWAEGTGLGGKAAAATVPGTPAFLTVWSVGDSPATKSDMVVDDNLAGSNVLIDANVITAGLTVKRRRGWILWDGAAVVKFFQDGDEITLDVPITDISRASSSSAQLATLSVPPDPDISAKIIYNQGGVGVAQSVYALITATKQANTAASSSAFNFKFREQTLDTRSSVVSLLVPSDVNSQIRTRSSAGGNAEEISTGGWVDRRG